MSRCLKLPAAFILACLLALALPVLPARADDESNASEIIYRASLGRADDVALLIKQGASADQKNGSGIPIISVAAQRTDAEGPNVIRTLAKLGANVNARDSKGQTALFYAARTGNVEAVNALLESGVDMYALDANGDVARTVAGNSAHENVVEAIDKFRDTPKAPPAESKSAPPAAESPAKPPESPVKPVESPAAPKAESPPAESPAAKTEEKKADISVTDTSKKEADTAADKKPESPASDAKKEDGAKQSPKMDITVTDKAVPDKNVGNFLLAPAPGSEAESTEPPMLSEEEMAAKMEHDKAASAQSRELQEQLAQKRQEELNKLAYDISYHTCSFQYWSFVEQVKLKSELSSEELTIAIQSHKDQVSTVQKKLLYDYKVPAPSIDKVTSSAQVRIYGQLNGMPSNRVRRQNGIGKMEDMQARCEEIARQWSALVQARGQAAAPEEPSAAGEAFTPPTSQPIARRGAVKQYGGPSLR